MKNIIYTIGYTSFDINSFIDVLKGYKIRCLIDVRSNPSSAYYVDFNLSPLKDALETNSIIYRNYKNEFGARQENKAFYTTGGYLDFDIFSQSQQFLSGIEKVKTATQMGYRVCLMCAEKDPFNCHRTILVARQLALRGFAVLHILADKTTCSQTDIDKRLLQKFFPNLNQLSIFPENNLSAEEALNLAYQKRNQEIGFRLEDEE